MELMLLWTLYKADIEDCERQIEMYKEKLEKLKKEAPKDLVNIETGFDN